MNRLPDWELRLIGLIEEKENRCFDALNNNCATFVQQAVEAVTGVVYGSCYLDGSVSLPVARTFVIDKITEFLGNPTQKVETLRSGDVVATVAAPGILYSGRVVMLAEKGITTFSRDHIRFGWRIG